MPQQEGNGYPGLYLFLDNIPNTYVLPLVQQWCIVATKAPVGANQNRAHQYQRNGSLGTIMMKHSVI